MALGVAGAAGQVEEVGPQELKIQEAVEVAATTGELARTEDLVL